MTMDVIEKRMCSSSMSDNGDGDRSATHLASVEISDIPSYLHKSGFFRSLQHGDGENSRILVPNECMKMDDSVNSRYDLRSLLLTFRFWVIDGISDSVLDFAMSQPFESYENILSEFYEDFPTLRNIQMFKLSLTPMVPAIESGVLDFVKYFLKRGHPWPDRTCDLICKLGNAVMLEYAIEEGCSITAEATVVAVGEGHIACLKLLHANNANWDARTTTAAAKGGHVDCLQYAHENGCPWLCSEDDSELSYWYDNSVNDSDSDGEDEEDVASDDASTQILEMNPVDEDDDANSGPMSEYDDNPHLDDGDGESDDDSDGANYHENNICTIASANGSIECLQYAHSQGAALQSRVIKAAARHPNGLECLKYAHQQGLPLTLSLSFNAAANGNLEMYQYLHAHGGPWSKRVCDTAAYKTEENEHSACKMVLFLLRNGCPPSNNIWGFTGEEFHKVLKCFLEVGLPWSATPEATTQVTRNNYLEGLHALVKHGCPCDRRTVDEAAMYSNLDILKYAHENGAPWTSQTCWLAANVGSLACLEYAHIHGARLSTNMCARMLQSNYDRSGQISLDCFIYAHKHGKCVLLPTMTSYAAQCGQLDLLQYLHENGCSIVDRAAVIAAKYGHAECLEYILCRGGIYSDEVYEAARAKEHESCMLIAEKYAASAPEK